MSVSKGQVIMADGHSTALLNLFKIRPDQQYSFLELQIEQTRRFRIHRPGFISSAFHRSLDGTRLLNFAFWERAEDVAAARQSDAFRGHLGRLDAFDYENEMHLYEIVAVYDEGRPPQMAVDDGLVINAAFFRTDTDAKMTLSVRLIDKLTAALSERWPEQLQSATVLKGLDGKNLAIYLQWHRGKPAVEVSALALAHLGIVPIGLGAVPYDECVYEVVDVSFAHPEPTARG